MENNQSFIKRFYIYQKERFPILAHGLLISIFTFSAISYSRICRGAVGFIAIEAYFVAAFTTITLFYLLRVSDEHKDAQDDAQFRKHLPVPRGLISLKELRITAVVVFTIQLVVNILYYPKALLLYSAVVLFLFLMTKEFFVSAWMKKKPVVYALSHMFIIPLVDIYASGMDWLREGAHAPLGLLFFFIVSYLNGLVLEVGRKIKIPEKDEHNTYSTLYGMNKATIIWLCILFVDLVCSITASVYAGLGTIAIVVLIVLFLLSSIPAWLFLKKKTEKISKQIENFSGYWTMAMYLTLGGIPMITKLIASWF